MTLSQFIQTVPDFIINHKGMIFIISIVVSLLFALVIFSLLQQFKVLQNDKWVKPFAWAFFVLAIMYTIRFVLWVMIEHSNGELSNNVTYTAEALIVICSSLSNYFFFAVVFPLARKGRRLRSKILKIFHLSLPAARYVVLALLIMVALFSMIEVWWARIPDVFLSTLTLGFVGLVFYRNISFRRNPSMAWLALITAIFYALLHVIYGLHPWIAETKLADWLVGEQGELAYKIKKLDSIVYALALPLKFGLFFPGYALILMIANPVGEVRRLLEGVTDGTAELLDDDGMVFAIKEEIQASQVELYIRAPGTSKNLIVRYSNPPLRKEKGEPDEFLFNRNTPYGHVMTTGVNFLFRLINYSDEVPGVLRSQLADGSSVIAVPILFHNAVIGCLKAELNAGKFTEADMQNIQRFAAMLSPAVQDYREVDALNEISHRLTRLQIEANGYDIKEAANSIAKITHDILAPLATGVSIEAGFLPYKAVIPKDGDNHAMMIGKLNVRYSELVSATESDNLKWWPKKLKITSNELGEHDNEHFFGKLVMASYLKWDRAVPPTLATNFFHRRVVSNLITEAFLSFIRGYLTDVAKELGVRLSGLREATIANWFKTIDKIALEAHLPWSVTAGEDSSEMLGKEKDLVLELEGNGVWVKKDTYDEQEKNNLDLWLCTLKSPRNETSHVIRITSRETKQTIWLGVTNPMFNLELDYQSPWKAFILRFGVIANTALQRILHKEERENLEKEAAEFHGLATAAITTGTVIHQMVNQVRDLTSPLTTLENAIRFRTLQGNDNHRRLIRSLGKSANQIEELIKLFSGVTKPDDRRPCSLNEAVQYAFNLLRDSFIRYGIYFNPQVQVNHVIDVPFYVAAFALANLLNNAKDAIRDGKVKDGTIEIKIEDKENMLWCHVIDNGPGVPSRFHGHLFTAGGKGDKPHGSGLGLYLSARSLREARGDLKLTAPGPHPQTTFTIYFPKQRKD